MKLKDVMEEIANKLEQFTKLTVYSYPVESVPVPCGILSFPDKIEYDVTYQGGEMAFVNLPVYMVTSRNSIESSRNKLSEWTAPTGNNSVKQYLDRENYISCEDVQVVSASFDWIDIGGVAYVAAVFELNVTGEGT